MKGLMSKMFVKSKGPGVTLKMEPVKLKYQLHCARWHTDNRKHRSLVMVHDLLGSSCAWSAFASEVANLPRRKQTPSTPLHMFGVDLRNHGLSPHTAATDSTVWHYVNDLVHFTKNVVAVGENECVHIVGMGFGGRVATLAALAAPDLFESVIAIGDCRPGQTLENPSAFVRFVAGLELGHTVADCEALLKPQMPNEYERLALLSNVVENSELRTNKRTSASWQFNLPVLAETAEELGKWPGSSMIEAASYKGTTLLINDVDPKPFPSEITKHFPKVSEQRLRGQWGTRVIARDDAAAVVDVILGATDLLSDLDEAVNPSEASSSPAS